MDRWVSVVYCDDIRNEIGGKTTYVGVYGTVLYVPSFPIALPKLCVWVNAFAAAERPFERAMFRVTFENALVIEAEIDKDQLGELVKQNRRPAEFGAPAFLAVGAHLAISPFNIEKPGVLRVRVETESEELKGPALRLATSPAPE